MKKILFVTLTLFMLSISCKVFAGNKKVYCPEENNNTSLLLLKYDFNNYNNLISPSELNETERSEKSPWLAFGLSLMFPGLGQIYNGDYTKAAIQAGLVLGGFGVVSLTGCTECGQSGELQTVAFFTGLGLTFVGYIWSLFDAPLSANNINDKLNYKDIKQAFNKTSGKNHKLYLSSNNLISVKIKF